MDYEQDYSKLNDADNQWCDFRDNEAMALSGIEASSTQASEGSRCQELTADMLDNEDFD